MHFWFSGCHAAIIDELLPIASVRLGINCVVFPVSENMVPAFKVVLLSCLRADLCALLV